SARRAASPPRPKRRRGLSTQRRAVPLEEGGRTQTAAAPARTSGRSTPRERRERLPGSASNERRQLDDGRHQDGGLDGRWQVLVEALDEGAGAVLLAREGGEGDGGGAAALFIGQGADAPDQGVAVLDGHADVGDDDVGRAALE